jgi:trigger factor
MTLGKVYMKIEMEQVSSFRQKMTVVVPAEQVDKEVNRAYSTLQKSVRLRGFRPGKAPLSILQRYFKTQVEEDVVSTLVQDSYIKALDEYQISPVSAPIIEKGVLEKGKDFSYTASFEIKPAIVVQGYTGLALEKEKVQVTEADIEEQLKKLQNTHATLKTVEGRSTQPGDCVVIDYEGTVEGRPLSANPIKDHLLEIASDSFLPGFSENLIGLRPGDKKSFTLQMPEDSERGDLAGKQIDFAVVVKEIKEKIVPPLDDEFARDLGAYQDLADLKQKIRESLLAFKEQQREDRLKDRIVTLLIEKNPFEVPPSLVEQQIQSMLSNTRQRLAAQGVNVENFSQSAEKLSELYREPAEKQVRAALLLEAVAEAEQLTVTEQDLERKYEEIARIINRDPVSVKQTIDRKNLTAQLREEKALAFIISQATITEI